MIDPNHITYEYPRFSGPGYQRESEQKLLQCREIVGTLSKAKALGLMGKNTINLGYCKAKIREFTRYSMQPSHDGCINTARWSSDGLTLITGSDDRHIKVWKMNDTDHITLAHSVRTKHRGNIFCVVPSPVDNNVVFSCAADGSLIMNDLGNVHNARTLFTSEEIMHMFLCDNASPQIIYTAEECGIITRVDLRINITEKIFTNYFLDESGFSLSPGYVKTLAQANFMGGKQLLVGGKGLSVGLLDLRLINANTDTDRHPPSYIKTWDPSTETICGDADYRPMIDVSTCCRQHRLLSTVSMSGLQVSKDDRHILASYQGDQIYTFDLNGAVEDHNGASAVAGGHINYSTFLKNVSYFGQNDEYILSGSDSGHVWIWDAKPKNAYTDMTYTANHKYPICDVVNVLKADSRTCNGVVPHPYYPIFASYGIDSDVKIWGYKTADDDKEHADGSKESSKMMSPRNVKYLRHSNGQRIAITDESLKVANNINNIKNEDNQNIIINPNRIYCKYGGNKDVHKLFRAPVIAYNYNRFMFDNKYSDLCNLPALLEKNKKLARSLLSDITSQSPPLSTAIGRVADPSLFNDIVQHIRDNIVGKIFLNSFSNNYLDSNKTNYYCHEDYDLNNNDNDKIEDLFTRLEKIIDCGSFCPSDYIIFFIGKNSKSEYLTKDRVKKVREFMAFMEQNLSSNNNLNDWKCLLSEFTYEEIMDCFKTSIIDYNHYDSLREQKDCDALRYISYHLKSNHGNRMVKYLTYPIFQLYHIAYIAKQNGNKAFQAKDYEIAHYFYCKACRYLDYIQFLNIDSMKIFSDKKSKSASSVINNKRLSSRNFMSSLFSWVSSRDDEENKDESEDDEEDEEDEEDEDEADSDEDIYERHGVDLIIQNDSTIHTISNNNNNNNNNNPVITPIRLNTEELLLPTAPSGASDSTDISTVNNNEVSQPIRLPPPLPSIDDSNNNYDRNHIPSLFFTPSSSCNSDFTTLESTMESTSRTSSINTVNITNVSPLTGYGSSYKTNNNDIDTTHLLTSSIMTPMASLAAPYNKQDEIMDDLPNNNTSNYIYDPENVDKIRIIYYHKLAPELSKTVLSNLSATFIHMGLYEDAINCCNDALKIIKVKDLSDDAKLLYRRGIAYLSLKNYDDSIIDLQAASKIAPNDNNIINKLKEAIRYHDNSKAKEMKRFSRMFSDDK
eukprot:gene10156-13663_t